MRASPPPPRPSTAGERNANPGNIVFDPRNDWMGQCGQNGRFAVFESPLYGIRALAKILRRYQAADGCGTVAALIRRWAPPVENRTAAYIADVSRRLACTPDAALDLRTPETLAAVAKAIIIHENGRCLYDDALIREAVALALE